VSLVKKAARCTWVCVWDFPSPNWMRSMRAMESRDWESVNWKC